jgi:hypothetical protein
MDNRQRDLLLDCMSYLWTVSRRAEDYWIYVGSLEKDEALSYFNSLTKYPTQIGSLFGKLTKDEGKKIFSTLLTLNTRKNIKPGFFECSLWAILIDVKSSVMRREFFRIALELDGFSRRMLGSPGDMTEEMLLNYIDLAKKYISLSKHVHPAFSHSEQAKTTYTKKEVTTG